MMRRGIAAVAKPLVDDSVLATTSAAREDFCAVVAVELVYALLHRTTPKPTIRRRMRPANIQIPKRGLNLNSEFGLGASSRIAGFICTTGTVESKLSAGSTLGEGSSIGSIVKSAWT